MYSPDNDLPDCMMPDGGQACGSYARLYAAFKAQALKLEDSYVHDCAPVDRDCCLRQRLAGRPAYDRRTVAHGSMGSSWSKSSRMPASRPAGLIEMP